MSAQLSKIYTESTHPAVTQMSVSLNIKMHSTILNPPASIRTVQDSAFPKTNRAFQIFLQLPTEWRVAFALRATATRSEHWSARRHKSRITFQLAAAANHTIAMVPNLCWMYQIFHVANKVTRYHG